MVVETKVVVVVEKVVAGEEAAVVVVGWGVDWVVEGSAVMAVEAMVVAVTGRGEMDWVVVAVVAMVVEEMVVAGEEVALVVVG